ncbi:MAG: type II toxin-antitoxin system VapC family toxin [Anaerolineales bacterium]|nr:type II toxin-antitoxin system VapC family toxin [Anaerolineales bacterium]
MSAFTLDASLTMTWCFQDEADSYADRVLNSLTHSHAVVPEIWPLEVGNVLLVAERHVLLASSNSSHFLDLLRELPIQVEYSTQQRMFSVILNLARDFCLSSYDAAYLDLAFQTGFPLATLEKSL